MKTDAKPADTLMEVSADHSSETPVPASPPSNDLLEPHPDNRELSGMLRCFPYPVLKGCCFEGRLYIQPFGGMMEERALDLIRIGFTHPDLFADEEALDDAVRDYISSAFDPGYKLGRGNYKIPEETFRYPPIKATGSALDDIKVKSFNLRTHYDKLAGAPEGKLENYDVVAAYRAAILAEKERKEAAGRGTDPESGQPSLEEGQLPAADAELLEPSVSSSLYETSFRKRKASLPNASQVCCVTRRLLLCD